MFETEKRKLQELSNAPDENSVINNYNSRRQALENQKSQYNATKDAFNKANTDYLDKFKELEFINKIIANIPHEVRSSIPLPQKQDFTLPNYNPKNFGIVSATVVEGKLGNFGPSCSGTLGGVLQMLSQFKYTGPQSMEMTAPNLNNFIHNLNSPLSAEIQKTINYLHSNLNSINANIEAVRAKTNEIDAEIRTVAAVEQEVKAIIERIEDEIIHVTTVEKHALEDLESNLKQVIDFQEGETGNSMLHNIFLNKDLTKEEQIKILNMVFDFAHERIKLHLINHEGILPLNDLIALGDEELTIKYLSLLNEQLAHPDPKSESKFETMSKLLSKLTPESYQVMLDLSAKANLGDLNHYLTTKQSNFESGDFAEIKLGKDWIYSKISAEKEVSYHNYAEKFTESLIMSLQQIQASDSNLKQDPMLKDAFETIDKIFKESLQELGTIFILANIDDEPTDIFSPLTKMPPQYAIKLLSMFMDIAKDHEILVCYPNEQISISLKSYFLAHEEEIATIMHASVQEQFQQDHDQLEAQLANLHLHLEPAQLDSTAPTHEDESELAGASSS